MILILLPSKTTHKLQPLDVGVFASVQYKWSRHCDERLAQGVRINRFNFIPEYLAIHRTLTPSLVQKAFAKTGIYPLNPTIFNDHDFAPSQASSSISTFPPSYPPLEPEPSEISGSSDNRDGLGVSSDSLSPSTDRITGTDSPPSPSIIPYQPTLPTLPPYEHIINQSPKDLWDLMRLHQIRCETVLKEVIAQRDVANTHCAIARHRIDTLTKQLANKTKSKQQKSKKVEARVLTLPELRGEFDIKEAEDEAKEKVELEKAAQKKADDMARTLRINEEIRNRVFDCPLTSYKRKDDLVALAGALSLPMDGTVVGLVKVIKEHLDENPTLANEPRFKGLFGSSRKRSSARAAGGGPSSLNSSSMDLEDTLIPNSPSYPTSHTPFSGGPTSMSYIHPPYNAPSPYMPLTLMYHNMPFRPFSAPTSNLPGPYHT